MMIRTFYILLLFILSNIAVSQPIFRNNGAKITTSGAIFVRVENLPMLNSASTGVTTTKGEIILKDNAEFKVNEELISDIDCKINTHDISYLYVLKNLTNQGKIDIYDNSIIAIIKDLINSGPVTNESQIHIGE